MSALASGFEEAKDFFKAIAPVAGDLGAVFIGACYRQKHDVCWVPNRAFEIWVVTKIKNNIVTIQPNYAKWARGSRRVSKTILRTEYILCAEQRQKGPC